MVKIEQLTQKLNEFYLGVNSHTHEIPTGVVAVAGSATAQSNPRSGHGSGNHEPTPERRGIGLRG